MGIGLPAGLTMARRPPGVSEEPEHKLERHQ